MEGLGSLVPNTRENRFSPAQGGGNQRGVLMNTRTIAVVALIIAVIVLLLLIL